MPFDINQELDLERLRQGFLKYTREAFNMLPEMSKPRILDIGCGTGIPTLELAELSDGEIIGIDIDGVALKKLKSKIEQKGFSKRIKVFKCPFNKNGFPDETFSLLWDEGVLHILDTKKSAKECFRLLKTGGYLVLGETVEWLKRENDCFIDAGFTLKSRLFLPQESWLTEYYLPLEKKIKSLMDQYSGYRALTTLKRYEREIETVKKNPREFDCAFYIFQKKMLSEIP
jgi:ubiquinone/menaquinone biosynthesis C-methylase UbiE